MVRVAAVLLVALLSAPARFLRLSDEHITRMKSVE